MSFIHSSRKRNYYKTIFEDRNNIEILKIDNNRNRTVDIL